MAKMYIMGAGHSFNMGDSAYAKLISFAGKASLLGIESKISPKTYDSAISLFAKCSQASKSGDYVIIVDEMLNPHGDIGKTMLCEWFGIKLEKNEQVLEKIQKIRGRKQNLPLSRPLERLSMLPEGSILIENPVGIAPGYVLDIQDKLFFFLPHKPATLISMLEECVLPILANLSDKEMATANVTATGLDSFAIEARLTEPFRKEQIPTYFECFTKDKTIEITLTVFAEGAGKAEALASRCTELVKEHLWPNILEEDGGLMANAIPEMLRNKKISLAAAVTGKELTKGFATLLPGVFRYLFNADSPAVREMVLEVPRAYLHENGGINRRAAMYMAHNVTAICEAEAGFALIMEQGTPQAVMAVSIAGQVAVQEFTLPDDLTEHGETEYACRYAMRFCSAALEAYPEDIPDSVSAADFLAGEETLPSAFNLLRPNLRRAGA